MGGVSGCGVSVLKLIVGRDALRNYSTGHTSYFIEVEGVVKVEHMEDNAGRTKGLTKCSYMCTYHTTSEAFRKDYRNST